MRMIKNDFEDEIAVLGLKKILVQSNMDSVFWYRNKLINYQRFCYNDELFKDLFTLCAYEKERLGRLLFENDLSKLEKVFEEMYPLLF